ncbi:ankyrin repeat domain-containing protein [Wolbachia endosymbiont (group A) of Pipizella viduata]|uniref:ankyrin repeat domain-containing protein n=1 Tax=Wolbachia endosymbiont (group A) of Pipizella viduata TaxID=3066154 RepID=UPI00333F32F8
MTIEKMLKKTAKKIYHFRHPSLLSLIVFETIKTIINTRLGTKILYFSAKHNLYNLFLSFVRYDANVDLADRKGNTVLHVASQYGSTAIAEVIIAISKNVNVQNIDGDTPLHYSVKYGCMDVMQKLLQSGADINCQNHLGESPLHIAAQCSDGVILGLLAKG